MGGKKAMDHKMDPISSVSYHWVSRWYHLRPYAATWMGFVFSGDSWQYNIQYTKGSHLVVLGIVRAKHLDLVIEKWKQDNPVYG